MTGTPLLRAAVTSLCNGGMMAFARLTSNAPVTKSFNMSTSMMAGLSKTFTLN